MLNVGCGEEIKRMKISTIGNILIALGLLGGIRMLLLGKAKISGFYNEGTSVRIVGVILIGLCCWHFYDQIKKKK